MRLKLLNLTYLVIFVLLGCDQPLYFDQNGFPHGTGERVYRYQSGAIKLREDYVKGEPVRSRWFGPDGTLIQETRWVHGTGEGLYLRDDGSIRTRMQYANGVAEGDAIEYDEAGNVLKLVQYRDGQRISERKLPAAPPAP